MMNLTAGMTIEPGYDFGFSTMDVQESLILREGERTYTNRNGILVKQPVLWMQGLTSEPSHNKLGTGSKPSIHFKVHFVEEDGEVDHFAVSAFGKDVVDLLSGFLLHRQTFVHLKKVDVRHSVIQSTMGLTAGEDIAVKSLAINFINQIDLKAVFAPRPNAWALAMEKKSKDTEAEIQPCPF